MTGEPHGDSGDWAAWLQRAQRGDAAARERVVAALYDAVAHYLARRLATCPADVVDDATQEAMISVARVLRTCRAVDGPQIVRWATVVGWHAALRYLRSPAAGLPAGLLGLPLDEGRTAVALDGGRQRSRHACPPTAAVPADLAIGTAGGGEEEDPGVVVLLLGPIVRRACQVLGAERVVLVWTRMVEDVPYAAMATTLRTTPGGAKRRVQRTVAALRRAILDAVAQLPERERAAVVRHLGAAAGPPGPGDAPRSRRRTSTGGAS